MPDVFTNPNKSSTKQAPAPTLPTPDAKTIGFFSSYCTNPKGINFANQEHGETIILFLRRHFITNVPWIVSVILLLIFPALFSFLTSSLNIGFSFITPELSLILYIFYYIFILNYAFLKFINWFYHVGIVTQKRLIDLDIDNILHYHLAETGVSDIVDVSYSQKGFFQSFFKYGDVPIQTEALKANFEFEHTPHPGEVADLITDLRPKEKGGQHHNG